MQTDLSGINGRILSFIPESINMSVAIIPQPPISIYDFSTASVTCFGRLPTYNADGSLKPFRGWEAADLGFHMEFPIVSELITVFDFVLEDLDSDGEYYILFNILDIQGNTFSSDLIPIELR